MRAACQRAQTQSLATPGHVVLFRDPAFAAHGVEEHLLRRVRPCVRCHNGNGNAHTPVRLASGRLVALTLPAPLLSVWWAGRASPSGMEDLTRSVDSRRLQHAVHIHLSAAHSAFARHREAVRAHLWPGAGLLLSVAAELGLGDPVSPQPAPREVSHLAAGVEGTDNSHLKVCVHRPCPASERHCHCGCVGLSLPSHSQTQSCTGQCDTRESKCFHGVSLLTE